MSTDVMSTGWVPSVEEAETEAADHKAFGFWIYIMSDCVLFAALFATFAVIGRNDAGGPGARTLFDLRYTLGETLFLLTSSVTFGFAMLETHADRRQRVLGWLVVTFLLGLGFIGMELHEFHAMIAAGDGPQRSGFLSAFFTLVGTHGAHVTVGLVWMLVMIVQVLHQGLSTPVRSRLMRLGMFWHFLDIVWVGVFSVVYLMGMMW